MGGNTLHLKACIYSREREWRFIFNSLHAAYSLFSSYTKLPGLLEVREEEEPRKEKKRRKGHG